MALYVNTNVSSINAQRKLANSTLALNTSYQRLSSGLRINSSKDDAAGLQISDRLTSQINGLNQGNRNANDGIALCQTIEGAMDEMTNMLQRIRTLAVQAANGTNTEEDRRSLQQEVRSLSEEITRISVKSTFAGATILNTRVGMQLQRNGEYFFQVGANANDEITIAVGSMDLLTLVDGLVYKPNDDLTTTKNQNSCGLKFDANTNGQKSKIYWTVSTAENAQGCLKTIDRIIEKVDSKRAALGAIQNRMESTVRNQSSIAENESDARSRIRDTDFASETASLTQNQIIQQASQTILMQANQRPTIALSMLGG